MPRLGRPNRNDDRQHDRAIYAADWLTTNGRAASSGKADQTGWLRRFEAVPPDASIGYGSEVEPSGRPWMR
jgi:hypothetical protein